MALRASRVSYRGDRRDQLGRRQGGHHPVR
jgi:hypothetical protein